MLTFFKEASGNFLQDIDFTFAENNRSIITPDG